MHRLLWYYTFNLPKEKCVILIDRIRIVAKYMFIIFTVFFVAFVPKAAHAATGKSEHVIILVVDQIGLNDLCDKKLSNFYYLVNNGAIALMNNSTGGDQIPDDAFVTINASSRAIGGPLASQSFNADEYVNGKTAADLYLRRYDATHISPQNVINLCAPKIQLMNKDRHYIVYIGALGDELHKAGLKTSVLGNSDSSSEDAVFPYYIRERQAATMLMDSQGVVDYGDVSGNIVINDNKSPFGIRTDNEKLIKSFIENYQRSSVIVINYGDTARAVAYAQAVSDKKAEAMMETALNHADTFLGRLLKNIDLGKDRLLIVVPDPSPANKRNGNTLTPVLMIGSGVEKGLLTSGTTNRPGIVTNLDVAPSVLALWNIDKSPEMFGQDMRTVKTDLHTQMNYLRDLQAKLVQNSLRRVPLLSTVAYYILVVLALSLLMFILRLFNVGFSRLLKKILLGNYLAAVNLPSSILMMGVLGALTLFESYMAMIVMTLLLTCLLYPLYKKYTVVHYVLAVCLLFDLVLFIDLFRGANIILFSPLGYDPQYGARFYGIGNELMGAVIGATTLGLAAFTDIKKFRGQYVLVGIAMVFILLVMVFPGLGSKAGASISVTAAFITLFWLLLGLRAGKKQIFAIVGSILLVLAFIAIVDSAGTPHTHIGRAVQEIQVGGWGTFYDIIQRKLAMNFRLMRNSYWSGMLVESLFIMLLMFRFRLKFLEHIREKTPNTLKGCFAALLGATVALLTNDAGIIAAATAVIYPIFCLLLLNLLPVDGMTKSKKI